MTMSPTVLVLNNMEFSNVTSKNVGNPEQTKRDMAEMEHKMGLHYANRNQYEINKLARPYKSYK